MKIDVGCATGRDLRYFGHRANLLGGQNERYFGRNGDFSEHEEKEDPRKKARMILSAYRVFIILQGKQKDVNNANLLKETRKPTHRHTFPVGN